MPGRKTIPILLSFLCSADPQIKQRAVTALGVRVSDLAAQDMEAAREVMRRLMWGLNEESGSSGWGLPEAMAEILATHEGLAREYAGILVSYLRSDGNYLEHIPLQRDLLRGIGRLAGARPRLLAERGADLLLSPYLESPDPGVRGLAAWCAGLLRARQTRDGLGRLLVDPAETVLVLEGVPVACRVGDLAREALALLDTPFPSDRASTA
jgi:hypothetical protein